MLMVTTKPTRDAEPNAPTWPRATLWMSVIVEPPAQTTTSGTAAMAGPAPPSTWIGSGYGFQAFLPEVAPLQLQVWRRQGPGSCQGRD